MQFQDYLVLGVALITWGVFFFYLLRLGAMTHRLENEIRAAEAARNEADTTKTPVA